MKKAIFLATFFLFTKISFSQWLNVGGTPPDQYLLGRATIGNTTLNNGATTITLLDVGTTIPSSNGPSAAQTMGICSRTANLNTNGIRIGGSFYCEQKNHPNADGITGLSGFAANGYNGAGTVSYLTGVLATTEHRGSSTVTWARAVKASGWLTNSGNIDNYAAFYSGGLNLGTNGTGTVNNGYGLYIEPFTSNVSNKWAIYAPDINALSEFGGTVFINPTGSLLIPNNAASGKILTCDAFGYASWQLPNTGSSGVWNLTGNNGTVDGVNYLGTNDPTPLNFAVNKVHAGRIDPVLQNTFYGMYSGAGIFSPGSNNTAIGYQTMLANAGSYNTAIGVLALEANFLGINNTALGTYSLYSNGGNGAGYTGNNNTAAGMLALNRNFTGGNNTAVGYSCLDFPTTGTGNSAFGDFANVGSLTQTNATAIGSHAVATADNMVRLGNSAVTIVEGGALMYTQSDGRFKNNISETDVKGLEFINRLRPVVYNFDTKKYQEFITQNMPDSLRKNYFENIDFGPSTAIRQSGFIAQEVEQVAKEVNYDFNGVHKPASNNDGYSLAYAGFVVPLVKSVQELSKQNEELKKEMEELKALIKANAKTNIEGSLRISETNSDAKLFQNAPNPFNQSTTIKYSIPATAKKAVISISSISGTKIKEFDIKNKGTQSMEISGGQLTAGTYIYSLIVDDVFIDSRQMILTR